MSAHLLYPVMARTQSISDEQILQAAHECFLDRGWSATTADIARRAGISEGTIFKRFGTKERLFLKSMGVPEEPPWIALLEARINDEDVRGTLFDVCMEIVDFFLELIPKSMRLMSCHLDVRKVFKGQDDPPPVRAIRAMTAFFVEQQRRDRIGPMNPEVVARTLLGALHMYCFAEVNHLNEKMPMPVEQFVGDLVNLVLKGVMTESEQ